MTSATVPFQHDGVRSGKVRDIYAFGQYLLLVASDRVSVFDVVLPTEIPDKGRVLTGLSEYWFDFLGATHHLVTTNLQSMHDFDSRIVFDDSAPVYEGRCMLVHRTEVIPIECVVRGYLAGSGWADYQRTGSVCGITLGQGLRESEKLPEPIFTPATKAATGHDENISFDQMVTTVGDRQRAEDLRRRSIRLYEASAAYAFKRGIIIADTKFEFGVLDGDPILIDEVLTPDSSRFWPADQYQPGRPQPSFDKQYVRDYCAGLGWGKQPPGPALPPEVVAQTRAKYIEAYEQLVGCSFPWK